MNAKARALLVVVTAMFLWMCGSTGMESLGDAMVDMGQSLQDGAMSDAAAQSTCGTCTGGAVHMITAETDPARYVGGDVDVSSGDYSEIVTGPVVVTDVYSSATILELFVSTTGDCSSTGYGYRVFDGSSGRSVRGARIFVGAGEKLCSEHNATAFHFSGYRPYE